ncbi:hypothetical protein [Mycobacterium gastri]|uniref:hypothetical protein n=1 Tax=Mycobacterium gastri TaxID=1777 RepID=UPI0003E46426|nr:hypothetical protein [Mycobacterium gastri]ETW24007.1 hypothetical protein MGAST_10905 [Mycobacterium gastri 'Wayne']
MPQITASAKSRVIDVGGPPAVSAGRSTIIAGSDPTRTFGLFCPDGGGHAYGLIP